MTRSPSVRSPSAAEQLRSRVLGRGLARRSPVVDDDDLAVGRAVRRARSAARGGSSSWACAAGSRGAWGRAPHRRRASAARGSSPGGPGRCPSGATASRHRRDLGAGLRAVRAGAAAASWAVTTWCITATFGSMPKSVVGQRRRCPHAGRRSAVASWRRVLTAAHPARFDCVAHEHEAAGGPGHRALDEQQTALGVAFDDLEVERGDAARCRIWPAIFMPLNTRAGVAHAPIEPGERCFLWLPCDAPWPLKLWRCITPVKPCALADAGDVDAARRRRRGRRDAPGRPRRPTRVVDPQLGEVLRRAPARLRGGRARASRAAAASSSPKASCTAE